MTEQQDPSAPSRPGWQRFALVGGSLVIVAVIGIWLVSVFRGGQPAEPATAKPAAAPAAAAPAPSAPQPATTIEASREARPRPKKKEAAPAPQPAPEPAAPTTGELHIDTDVPGAMVFVDRKFVGNAPVTAKDLAPGRHQLNVTAEGFDSYSEPVDVAVGSADVMVRFKEIRLKEAVDVVHKHTMGSCEGRLLADPQGVRYETSNRDDAFALKFGEIETFEVDYLKKNLRIKKRGGKQYNFTTKAENADPLFVFHRNVDKVRQQVAGTAVKK
jgi:hypothetical protein